MRTGTLLSQFLRVFLPTLDTAIYSTQACHALYEIMGAVVLEKSIKSTLTPGVDVINKVNVRGPINKFEN